jgi:methionine--tRNA ligase beta chain
MNITIDEFQRLDIRVGTIVEAEVPEWSHYVMKLKIDLGSEIGERTIFAGIMNFYKPKDLIGKQSLFIVNLEPKKIGPEGDYSQGMMLMAVPSPGATAGKATPTREASADEAVEEELPPILLAPKKKVPNGTKIE